MANHIEHIVVLMLENRSFDHYFGFFTPAPGQTIENLTGANAGKFNLLDPSKPKSATNPSFPANQPAPFAVHDKEGPSHSFHAVCVQLCNDEGGPSAVHPVLNNGFARSYKDDLLRRTHQVDKDHIQEVMQSFSPGQLPAINQLARNFCLCDHWHCEVPGPTMPNRMFIHAATSEGYVHNDFSRPYTSRTIYELVAEKGLTWAGYTHDLNEIVQFTNLPKTNDHIRRFEDRWASDVRDNKLPNYSFIFPRFSNKKASAGSPAKRANSQHAPEDVRFGEHLIADVYDALAANQALFAKTLLVVTYDEHGGFYDHVVPGPAPNPDGKNSPNPDDTASFPVPPFSFDRLGLRVPTILVSPCIPKGRVEHRLLQHTSVLKTASELFGLNGPLNHRDASAASFADLFLAAPRPASDMPTKLDRPSLQEAVMSIAAGIPVDPADEPLDSLTEEWVRGMALLAARRTPATATATAAASPSLPAKQGDVAEFIDRILRRAYGI
jgi:phospholipase C